MKPSDFKKARDRLGLTQSELAIRAGISEQSIGRVERGVRVRSETLKALCAELQIPYAPMNLIEVIGAEALRLHPSSDRMLDGLVDVPNVRYLVRRDSRIWQAEFRQLSLGRRVTALGLDLWWKAHLLALVTLLFGAIAVTSGLNVFGPSELVRMAIEANIVTVVAAVVTGVKVWSTLRSVDRLVEDDTAHGIAVCEDALLTLTMTGDRLAIERFPIENGNVRRCFDHGPFKSYWIEDGLMVAAFHGMPQHAGLDLLLSGRRTTDRFQEIVIPEARAA